MSALIEENGAALGTAELRAEEEAAFAHMARAKGRANTMADRIARAAGYAGEIRPGALVKLKSGGPAMTVAVFDVVDGLIYCHWIVGGRPFAARYSAEMLESACAGDLPTPPRKRGVANQANGEREVSLNAAIISESQGESAREDSPDAATFFGPRELGTETSLDAAIIVESVGEFECEDSLDAAIISKSQGELTK